MTSSSTSTDPTSTDPTSTDQTSGDANAVQCDPVLDIPSIQSLLPHRYPFLLVDRVVSFERGKRIHAYKNVTLNEPFFQGHFPNRPVMPGVLVIEAMAQTGGLLFQLSVGGDNLSEKLFYLVKVDNAKFTRMVVPGDRLDMEVQLKRRIRNMAMYSGVARVDGEEAACAEFLCAEARD
ncbi:MAG: 3-hydroxyacyl-ACP dehydratase FabZ [Lysobacter sp.]|nr:3-hydroxyacyl-ACP dehydratase FabZ [Lysobacter sp.]